MSAILALTAIDVITEFVRGSEVQCYLPNETDSTLLANVQSYINEFCTTRLPSLQYFPAFIAIHAIAILAPHYIWLNFYGANLDFFFQHVSKLSRMRNPKTGDYPAINYTILKQLKGAFSRSNRMYGWYLIVVILQLGLCILGGLVTPLWLFKESEQSVPFECPREDSDTKGDDWPLPDYEKVICVVSSIHLLHKIWLIYLFLLALAAFFLVMNFLKMIWWHTDELGNVNRAIFSFQTGLSYRCYKSKQSTSLSQCLQCKSPYSIKTDYDFLVVKLFRTDGGLAYILREVHVLSLLQMENKSDRAKAYLYSRSWGGSREATTGKE